MHEKRKSTSSLFSWHLAGEQLLGYLGDKLNICGEKKAYSHIL